MGEHREALVAMCIATRGRPKGLAALVESLGSIVVPHGTVVRLIVVDNAPVPSVDPAILDGAAFDAELLHEPRPGIPLARNLAVGRSLEEGVTDLVFVDDDEVVTPGWLSALSEIAERTDADVVLGPVVPDLPDGTPRWLRESGAFHRPHHQDGELLGYAATNNVLVRRYVFERVRPWFDERFATSGGSDREFFARVLDHGLSVRWSADAVVRERVPASRARTSWVLSRAFRGGTHHGFIVRTHHGLLSRRALVEAGVALARCVLGGLGVSLAVLDRALGLRAARKFLLGLGTIAGLTVRYRVNEYRVIHGG